MKMKKISIRNMAEIAIFAALGIVLDLIQGLFLKSLFPNGGSIGIAMVPIFIMAYKRGLLSGILTGLIMGLCQMLGGVYVLPGGNAITVFFQVSLDYYLAYTVVGFAGVVFNKYQNTNNKTVYIITGVLFWPTDLWNVGGPVIFSILYNGLYMVPSTILCLIIMVVLSKKQSHLFKNDK
jgi:thiamine transporter